MFQEKVEGRGKGMKNNNDDQIYIPCDRYDRILLASWDGKGKRPGSNFTSQEEKGQTSRNKVVHSVTRGQQLSDWNGD